MEIYSKHSEIWTDKTICVMQVSLIHSVKLHLKNLNHLIVYNSKHSPSLKWTHRGNHQWKWYQSLFIGPASRKPCYATYHQRSPWLQACTNQAWMRDMINNVISRCQIGAVISMEMRPLSPDKRDTRAKQTHNWSQNGSCVSEEVRKKEIKGKKFGPAKLTNNSCSKLKHLVDDLSTRGQNRAINTTL